MYSLVSEMKIFKSMSSKVKLPAQDIYAVDRVINGTIASNETLLITILQYNVYSALKSSGKLCFPL